MQIFIDNQWSYLLYSILSGIVIGAVHDVLISLKYSFKIKNKYFQIPDFIFIIFCAFLYFIITYSKNYGSYRIYSLAAIYISFKLYNCTISKAVYPITFALFSFIVTVAKFICKKAKIILDICVKFVTIVIRKIISFGNSAFKKIKSNFTRKDRYEKRSKEKKQT